jgi:hypothetical protein
MESCTTAMSRKWRQGKVRPLPGNSPLDRPVSRKILSRSGEFATITACWAFRDEDHPDASDGCIENEGHQDFRPSSRTDSSSPTVIVLYTQESEAQCPLVDE